MQSLLDWLLTLPSAALYGVLALAAAVENVFPPFPSDVVVAFGSFVAAQGKKSVVGVVFAVWLGNVSTAMLVYALGRRYGAHRLEQRLAGRRAEAVDARLRILFQKHGLLAVFLSRFVPAVRSVVPAFAGAIRLSAWLTGAMIAIASAIWYGLITIIAYRVGTDWERLRDTVTRYSTIIGITAAVLLALGIGTWVLVRRNKAKT